MSTDPAVSVLLPVFNAGPTLRRAIHSILTQDFDDIELLIVDDCSSDGSLDVCREAASQDARVRVIQHAQNLGLAVSLNEGLDAARAPLVARMDHDDEALPERLGVQRAFLDAHPHVAVAGSYVLHMGARPRYDHLVELPTDADQVRETLKSYNCLYHPAVMFRRDLVRAVGGYRPDFVNAEDYDLWLRLSPDHLLQNIPQPLLRYRFSPGGQTLGRKWQQLYYVYLAQVMNSGDATSLEDARRMAEERLKETDRRYFFGEVAKGTVAELLRLRRWRDAARLMVRFENEMDEAVMNDLTRQVLRAAVPEVRAV